MNTVFNTVYVLYVFQFWHWHSMKWNLKESTVIHYFIYIQIKKKCLHLKYGENKIYILENRCKTIHEFHLNKNYSSAKPKIIKCKLSNKNVHTI